MARSRAPVALAGLISVLTLGTALWSCKREPSVQLSSADAWALARSTLLDKGWTCLDRHPRYCLRDPDDVDPPIQKVIERHHAGVMPTDSARVSSIGKLARAGYSYHWHHDPAAQQRVLELVRAYYEAPSEVRELSNGGVELDCGVTPAPFNRPARGTPYLVRSPEVVDSHVRAETVAARLRRVMQSHPGKEQYILRFRIPESAGLLITQSYRFYPTHGLIAVEETANRGTVYQTAATLDQLSRGEVSLGRSDMKFCSSVDSHCP